MTRRAPRVLLAAAGLVVSSVWLLAGGATRSPTAFRPSREPRLTVPWPIAPADADRVRAAALSRAEVWRPADPSTFGFAANPPDPTGELTQPIVPCRLLAKPATGTTPKFDCVLRSGEVVKVKYGRNPEHHAEAAATRLLTALGFGADTVFLVPRVRCYGCPRFPFHTLRLLDVFRAAPLFERHTSDSVYTDFEWVSVERRFAGHPIEANGESGWGWFELPHADSSSGDRRAQLDALRLAAVFLAHWDNKAANQRLVCLDETDEREELGEVGGSKGRERVTKPCGRPFALIQDAGATFGPRKVDARRWRTSPIWSDERTCTVSMRSLPWGGGTFPDLQISEAGRRLLTRQLQALSDDQVTALFTGARFPEFESGRWITKRASVTEWRSAFQERVRRIAEAGPCPS